MNKNQVWIGLFGVVPTEGSEILGTAKGAFVNILGYAANQNEFIDKVQIALNDLGILMFKHEDIEPFLTRIQNFIVDLSLIALNEEVIETKEIRFGDFYSFPDTN